LDNTTLNSLNFKECKLVQPQSDNYKPIDPNSHDYKHMHLDLWQWQTQLPQLCWLQTWQQILLKSFSTIPKIPTTSQLELKILWLKILQVTMSGTMYIPFNQFWSISLLKVVLLNPLLSYNDFTNSPIPLCLPSKLEMPCLFWIDLCLLHWLIVLDILVSFILNNHVV
jgi:hypothetical protein